MHITKSSQVHMNASKVRLRSMLLVLIIVQVLQATLAFQSSSQQLQKNLQIHHAVSPMEQMMGKRIRNNNQIGIQTSLIYKFRGTKTIMSAKYGKGAEIYPPTNDGDFALADSFPSGNVPPIAQAVVAGYSAISPNMNVDMNQNGSNKEDIDEMIDDEEDARYDVVKNIDKEIAELKLRKEKLSPASLLFDKLPIVSAFAMCFLDLRLISPAEFLWVIFFTGYLVLLSFLASSSKSVANVGEPMLPPLPPQRHVPDLIREPLGKQLTDSAIYRNWLKLGVILGYILPNLAVGFYKFSNQRVLAKLCAKGVFFISCQIITENVMKKIFAPLPLRILVTLVYNSIRMVGLYDWVMFPGEMKLWGLGRVLAVGNFMYWGLNLFGFLLPVATMRYMRSHFFCVEAEEVVLREAGF